MPDRPYRLLFVCSGNICRSPMAAQIADAYARQRGRAVEVRSAGTLGIDGREASEGAVQAMAEIGLDLGDQRSTGVRTSDLDWADYVLVMELNHAHWLRDRYPELGDKVILLGSLAGSMEIPDPIGRSLRHYRRVRDLIDAGVRRFIDALP